MSELTPEAGRLLVATPELADPNFTHTVILLLAVQDQGALGLVLNRPSETTVDEVMPAFFDAAVSPRVMFFGGPVGLDALEGAYLKAVWLLMGERRASGPSGSRLRGFCR